jgi:hypothetical protein
LTLPKKLFIIQNVEANLAIDSTLLERALQIGGMEAENETINLALDEFIKRRIGENIISAQSPKFPGVLQLM